MIATLYEDAVKQNVVIYNNPSLLVLAAPWRYALVCKIDRLSQTSDKKDKDLGDAVAYLHEIVKGLGHAVTKAELKQWAEMYKMKQKPKDTVLDSLEAAYHSKYGTVGVKP
jgi:hypothetical protein